jgi:hypothetical protein
MLSCDSSAHSSNWWSRLLKRLQRIYFHRQWPRKTVLVHSLTLKVTTFMEIILNGVFKLLRRYFVLTLCRITFVYPQLQGNQSWKGVNKWINSHVALFSSQYKSLLVTGCSWLVPGIRATLDTEIRRVIVQGHQGQYEIPCQLIAGHGDMYLSYQLGWEAKNWWIMIQASCAKVRPYLQNKHSKKFWKRCSSGKPSA